MKTSVEWLKEYTNVDVTTKDLADILTMTGTKVETIEEKGKEIQNVVVGKILTIEKHPDADIPYILPAMHSSPHYIQMS